MTDSLSLCLTLSLSLSLSVSVSPHPLSISLSLSLSVCLCLSLFFSFLVLILLFCFFLSLFLPLWYDNTLEKYRIGCSLRASVRAYVQQTGGTVHTSSIVASSEAGNVPCLSSILTALKEVTVVTLTAISHLTKAEEKRKIRKQDDIRKVC